MSCWRPDGMLYLHLDWRAVHFAKILLDEVFGPANFINEIIWVYHGPSPVKAYFNRKHDTILAYAKGKNPRFFPDRVRVPYHPSTLRTFASSSKAGFGKRPDLERGKIPEDWWYFPVIARLHSERTGYPTQKPEALLERILTCFQQSRRSGRRFLLRIRDNLAGGRFPFAPLDRVRRSVAVDFHLPEKAGSRQSRPLRRRFVSGFLPAFVLPASDAGRRPDGRARGRVHPERELIPVRRTVFRFRWIIGKWILIFRGRFSTARSIRPAMEKRSSASYPLPIDIRARENIECASGRCVRTARLSLWKNRSILPGSNLRGIISWPRREFPTGIPARGWFLNISARRVRFKDLPQPGNMDVQRPGIARIIRIPNRFDQEFPGQ